MSRVTRVLLIVLCGGVLLACCASPAAASSSGACSAKKAQHLYRLAHRAAVRAERRAAEARHVARATKAYSKLYGSDVARWTRLARRAGWGWGQLPTLMYIINRESRGQPHAVNSSSGCYGLLQLHPCHWLTKYGLKWIAVPLNQLRLGLKLWRGSGWQPWTLMSATAPQGAEIE